MKKPGNKARKSVLRHARGGVLSGRITYLDPMSDEFTAAMTDAFRKGVRAALCERDSTGAASAGRAPRRARTRRAAG